MDDHLQVVKGVHDVDTSVDYSTAVVSLLRPKSRGSIQLKSRDPFDYPVIEPNYLQHADDIKTLLNGT